MFPLVFISLGPRRMCKPSVFSVFLGLSEELLHEGAEQSGRHKELHLWGMSVNRSRFAVSLGAIFSVLQGVSIWGFNIFLSPTGNRLLLVSSLCMVQRRGSCYDLGPLFLRSGQTPVFPRCFRLRCKPKITHACLNRWVCQWSEHVEKSRTMDSFWKKRRRQWL